MLVKMLASLVFVASPGMILLQLLCYSCCFYNISTPNNLVFVTATKLQKKSATSSSVGKKTTSVSLDDFDFSGNVPTASRTRAGTPAGRTELQQDATKPQPRGRANAAGSEEEMTPSSQQAAATSTNPPSFLIPPPGRDFSFDAEDNDVVGDVARTSQLHGSSSDVLIDIPLEEIPEGIAEGTTEINGAEELVPPSSCGTSAAGGRGRKGTSLSTTIFGKTMSGTTSSQDEHEAVARAGAASKTCTTASAAVDGSNKKGTSANSKSLFQNLLDKAAREYDYAVMYDAPKSDQAQKLFRKYAREQEVLKINSQCGIADKEVEVYYIGEQQLDTSGGQLQLSGTGSSDPSTPKFGTTRLSTAGSCTSNAAALSCTSSAASASSSSDMLNTAAAPAAAPAIMQYSPAYFESMEPYNYNRGPMYNHHRSPAAPSGGGQQPPVVQVINNMPVAAHTGAQKLDTSLSSNTRRVLKANIEQGNENLITQLEQKGLFDKPKKPHCCCRALSFFTRNMSRLVVLAICAAQCTTVWQQYHLLKIGQDMQSSVTDFSGGIEKRITGFADDLQTKVETMLDKAISDIGLDQKLDNVRKDMRKEMTQFTNTLDLDSKLQKVEDNIEAHMTTMGGKFDTVTEDMDDKLDAVSAEIGDTLNASLTSVASQMKDNMNASMTESFQKMDEEVFKPMATQQNYFAVQNQEKMAEMQRDLDQKLNFSTMESGMAQLGQGQQQILENQGQIIARLNN
ncbi:unnamed protein product [Amoebophrya sp. A120]|nr:unnamed protein product [Amoebophrya sp. A120]|eukprot:GSA120T00013384001.1